MHFITKINPYENFFHACKSGNLEKIKYFWFLYKPLFLINLPKDGISEIIKQGNVTALKLLFDNGLKIRKISLLLNLTYPIKRNKTQLLSLLIDYGFHLKKYPSILEYAIVTKDFESVDFLINNSMNYDNDDFIDSFLFVLSKLELEEIHYLLEKISDESKEKWINSIKPSEYLIYGIDCYTKIVNLISSAT